VSSNKDYTNSSSGIDLKLEQNGSPAAVALAAQRDAKAQTREMPWQLQSSQAWLPNTAGIQHKARERLGARASIVFAIFPADAGKVKAAVDAAAVAAACCLLLPVGC